MNMTVSGLTPEAIPTAFIHEVRREVTGTSMRMIDVLEERMAIDADVFVRRLGVTVGYPVLEMADLHRLQAAFDVVPFNDALTRECITFRDPDGVLLLIFADPFNDALASWAGEFILEPFESRLVHVSNIAAYLAQHEETVRAIDGVLERGAEAYVLDHTLEQLSLKSIGEDTSPVVKLVNSTLYDALKSEASDIHLETSPAGMTIKYRIDGVLSKVGSTPGMDVAEQVISRIKVLAELDIAEKRIPQDGRFKVSIKDREVDFRVSIMPSIFGEDAVLRILDKQALADQVKGLRLDYLGFDAASMVVMRRLSNEPYGMVLVTGPTGSGKTTTLYAAITEINHGQDKIITIEDPVEYQLPGVLQIPVNEKKGLTFAKGLRSILRHDPDKILVGEIRDSETAQIAVQSALTGHLVFTTVHANNVFDVIGRFMHMGVDPYSFVSALNGIIAQRLLRVICTHCSEEYQPDAQLLDDSGISLADAKSFHFRHGLGCGKCRGSGFKGRKAIAEILHLNDEIRELIVSREPIRKIKDAARRNGTRYLRDTAVDLVRTGETSLQEINRVTFVG